MEFKDLIVNVDLSSTKWIASSQEIHLSSTDTIGNLKGYLIELAEKMNNKIELPDFMIGITVKNMKLFSGDSKPLTYTSDNFLKLNEVNIQSGDTITVKEIIPDVIIKCKVEGEDFTFEELSSTNTVGDLKNLLFEEMKIRKKNVEMFDENSFKFLCGYPPKPLSNQSDNLKLYEANIRSGDTVIIRIDVKDLSSFPNYVMRRQQVPSNDSCLFSSIQFIACEGKADINSEEFMNRSNYLREVVGHYIAEDPEKFNVALLGMTNAKYIEWITTPSNWGGYIELVILSDYLQIEIVVIDVGSSTKPLHFGENKNYAKISFLIYDGKHYDPLYAELPTGEKKTKFLVSDPDAWNMALELGNEAKSLRQYTDLVDCKLICCVCNEVLHGEKQATHHAMDTGHSNFKEFR